jgi:hypothetical protein
MKTCQNIQRLACDVPELLQCEAMVLTDILQCLVV